MHIRPVGFCGCDFYHVTLGSLNIRLSVCINAVGVACYIGCINAVGVACYIGCINAVGVACYIGCINAVGVACYIGCINAVGVACVVIFCVDRNKEGA